MSDLPGRAVRLQHRLDRRDRRIEPAGEFAVGRLQPPRARGLAIERRGELAAVRTERLQLLPERVLVDVALATALDGRVERIERKREPFHCKIDAALFR